MEPKHPMQPLVWDGEVIRFKSNKIVRFLQEWASNHGMDLNDLHLIPFDEDEWTQFNQLIGYSVSGFGELSHVNREAVAKADELAAEMAKAK